MDKDVLIKRPRRWDRPFGESMTREQVRELRRMAPFSAMDPDQFPRTVPLDELLANDTRIQEYKVGDLIVREGDYGHSAFLILEGKVRVCLDSLSPATLGRREPRKSGSWRQLARLFWGGRYPEQRDDPGGQAPRTVAAREEAGTTRVFLQDVPGVLDAYHTVELVSGQFFGEQAAISRTPRTATVFAASSARLLEIRWQGLRDMMRSTPALRAHIDQLYRVNSLETHLRETPLLAAVPPGDIPRIAAETVFESYGELEWHTDFRRVRRQEPHAWIQSEPIIGGEGDYADGLLLIRSGFARLSRRYGDGHRTLAYLGKGSVFGLGELLQRRKTGRETAWRNSLRAVGYVDVLRIPSAVVEALIVPRLSPALIERTLRDFSDASTESSSPAPRPIAAKGKGKTIPTDFLEFILDHRLMNGTQTMIIDLNRCTRCDDCVRACAATHDNNPRFLRTGPTHDAWMFAQACMHCADPVCMIGCPTGAIARETATGTIVINDRTCIGCGVCATSCPYDNIQMVEIRDRVGKLVRDPQTLKPWQKATKCDLCVDQWGGPACQGACPHDALVRIDMNDVPRLAAWTGGRG